MGKIMRDITGEKIANALNMIALASAGDVGDNLSWKNVRNIVRAGMGPKAYPIGTQFRVEKESSMTATLGKHTGVTAVSVNEETFLAAEGMVGSGVHEFVFDGAAWRYHDEPVNLSHFGITVTGTPAEEDEIVITEAFDDILWDVVDHRNVTDPVDGETKPAMILLMHNCIYGREVDALEALYYAAEAMAAGSYCFTVVDDPWKSENNNKTFYFTLTETVPAGGQVVVSCSYDTVFSTQALKTYSSGSSTTPIESTAISTTEIAGATDLGSTGTGNLNHIQRVKAGSNNYKESAIRQWINSGAAANGWWSPSNIFDRPAGYANAPGLLHGMDSEFVDVVRKLTVPCKTNNLFELSGWTLNTAYTVDDRFFLASRNELGYGTENVAEGSVFGLYNGASNADRIKRDQAGGSTARLWWLRSPYPGRADYVRVVYTVGSLGNCAAYDGIGAAAACAIY